MSEYEHIFDKESIIYGSELGVWYGKCKDCGLQLSAYTGTSNLKPYGVKRYDITRSMSSHIKCNGIKILTFNYDTFIKGYPNMILLYPKCERKEMTNTSQNSKQPTKTDYTTTTLPKKFKIVDVSKREARRVAWLLLKRSLFNKRITVLIDEETS